MLSFDHGHVLKMLPRWGLVGTRRQVTASEKFNQMNLSRKREIVEQSISDHLSTLDIDVGWLADSNLDCT